MKPIRTLFALLVLSICSCTSEPDKYTFTATLINESGTVLTAYFYYQEELVKTEILNNLEFTSCSYSAESFDEFRKCDNDIKIETITVVFSNGKGYTCNSFDPSSEQTLCFGESRNPLLSGFNNLGNRQYEFVITEEDFTNAYDLPL